MANSALLPDKIDMPETGSNIAKKRAMAEQQIAGDTLTPRRVVEDVQYGITLTALQIIKLLNDAGVQVPQDANIYLDGTDTLVDNNTTLKVRWRSGTLNAAKT